MGAVLYPRFHRLYPRVSSYGLLTVSLLTVISAASYLLTTAESRFPTGVRDLVDLARPFMIYLSCSLGFAHGLIPIQRVRRLCLLVLLVSLFCVAVLILQPPVLIDLVNNLYGSTKTGISAFMVRVSIPFENPNFLGLFSVLTLCIALFFFKAPDYLLAIVAIIVTALTGSRTAWLITLVVLLAYSAESFFHVLRGRRLQWVVIASALVTTSLFAARNLPEGIEANQRVTSFVSALNTFALLQDESYQERVAMRSTAVALIGERPIIGWGAIKDSQVDIVDNQYISLLIRVGLVGVLISVWAFAGLLARHMRAAGPARVYQVLLIWSTVLAWMWSGSFAENVRLSILIAMICASTVTHSERPRA